MWLSKFQHSSHCQTSQRGALLGFGEKMFLSKTLPEKCLFSQKFITKGQKTEKHNVPLLSKYVD